MSLDAGMTPSEFREKYRASSADRTSSSPVSLSSQQPATSFKEVTGMTLSEFREKDRGKLS